MRLVKDRAEITSRVALCLVFLTFSAILFAYMLLLASSSLAQSGEETTGETTGAAEDQYAPGPDEECPGAEIVQTTSGTGNRETAPFQVTGDRFRITAAVAPQNPTSDPFLDVTVERENGGFVSSFTVEQEGTESSLVNAGPGSFLLDIFTLNANYTIVVEDCAGDEPGNADNTDDANNVIDDSVPNKPLPYTGGFPLLGFAMISLAFLGVGVSILRRGR